MKSVKLIAIGICLAAISFIGISCINQSSDVQSNVYVEEKNDWYSISDIASLQQKENKAVLIDIYTDWCKWCHVMDEKTFSDQEFMSYLKKNFHLVKFNAEEKSTQTFKGEKFDFVKNGRKGYNQLAATLCKDKLSYPSFVILDKELNHVDVVRGYKDAVSFRQLLEQTML